MATIKHLHTWEDGSSVFRVDDFQVVIENPRDKLNLWNIASIATFPNTLTSALAKVKSGVFDCPIIAIPLLHDAFKRSGF